MQIAYLIVYGCNEYLDPNANLAGCGSDDNEVIDTASNCFNQFGWTVYNFFGKLNIAKDVKAAILEIAKKANPGDIIWIHNSSHGTTIPINGVKHHATVPYNFNWNDLSTFFMDTDYWECLSAFQKGTYVTFTTDSCFAKGLTSAHKFLNAPHIVKSVPRFLIQPQGMQDVLKSCKSAHPRGIIGDKLDIAAGFGCGEDQTSADVTGPDGHSFGAYTHTLLARLRENPKAIFSRTHILANNDLAENQFEQRCAWDGAQADKPWHGGFVSV